MKMERRRTRLCTRMKRRDGGVSLGRKRAQFLSRSQVFAWSLGMKPCWLQGGPIGL